MHTELRRRHRTLKKMGPMSEEARRALSELRDEHRMPLSHSFSLRTKELLDVGANNRNTESFVQSLDQRKTIKIDEREPGNLLLRLPLEERLFEDNDGVLVDEKQGRSAEEKQGVGADDIQGNSAGEKQGDNAIVTVRQEKEDSGINNHELNTLNSNDNLTNFINDRIELNTLRKNTKAESKRLGYKTFRSRGSVTVRSRAITHPGAYYTPRGQGRQEVFKDRPDTDIRSSFRSTDTLALPQLYLERDTEVTSRSEFQTKRKVGYSFDTGYESMISEISKMKMKNKSGSLDQESSQKPVCENNDMICTKTSTNMGLRKTEDFSRGSVVLENGPVDYDWDEQAIVQSQNVTDSHAPLDRYNKPELLQNTAYKPTLPGTSITLPQRLDSYPSVFNPRRDSSVDFQDEQKVSTSVVAAAVISRTNDITTRAIMEENRRRDLALLKFQRQPRENIFQPADRQKSFRVSAIGYDCRYETVDAGEFLPTVEDIDRVDDDDDERIIEEYRRQVVNKCEQWLKKYHYPSRVFSLY